MIKLIEMKQPLFIELEVVTSVAKVGVLLRQADFQMPFVENHLQNKDSGVFFSFLILWPFLTKSRTWLIFAKMPIKNRLSKTKEF